MSDPSLVVDYRFGKQPVTNPDGTIPATISGGSTVAGPGLTVRVEEQGEYSQPEMLRSGPISMRTLTHCCSP